MYQSVDPSVSLLVTSSPGTLQLESILNRYIVDSKSYPSCAISPRFSRPASSCKSQGITVELSLFYDEKGTLPVLGLDNLRGVGSCDRNV